MTYEVCFHLRRIDEHPPGQKAKHDYDNLQSFYFSRTMRTRSEPPAPPPIPNPIASTPIQDTRSAQAPATAPVPKGAPILESQPTTDPAPKRSVGGPRMDHLGDRRGGCRLLRGIHMTDLQRTSHARSACTSYRKLSLSGFARTPSHKRRLSGLPRLESAELKTPLAPQSETCAQSEDVQDKKSPLGSFAEGQRDVMTVPR